MDAFEQIDHDFLLRFPGALNDPDWQALGKKHRSIDDVIRLCREGLTQPLLQRALVTGNTAAVIECSRQIIGRCTTVSTFEKMAFRNYLGYGEVHRPFVAALNDVLHHFSPEHFEAFVDALTLCRHDPRANAAKWPVVTCFLAYSDPERQVCIKPTTIKKLAGKLGIDIAYQARPNYETYRRVQAMVQDFRRRSRLADGQNNIIAQAIMYCTV